MNSDLYAIGNIIEVQRRRHKFKTNEYQAIGAIPIIDQSTDFIAGFTDEVDRAYDGELPVIVFGDHTCCLKFIDFRFAVGADGTQLLRPVEGIDARYLYYALHAVDLKQFGYQRHFKLLKDCEVRVPPIETQRRIASILGAYDDLIEVNRRRIAVLEEMARELFEEWFICFHFPGHEAVPIYETPAGPLPEGWEQAAFGSLLEHTIGGLWGEASEIATNDQRVSVIRGTDFPRLLAGNYAGVPDRFVSNRELASRTLLSGDLILEASGGSKDQPVGRVLYVTASLVEKLCPPVAPASFCRLLRPKGEFGGGAYLYGLLQAMYQDKRIEKFQKQSTGLRNLSMKQLAAETVTVPHIAVLTLFGKATIPLLEAASLYRHECAALGASRDLLLPRLISGQLSVDEAESELEEAA